MLNNDKINILTIEDKDYPERLRNIYNPPEALYIKGSLPYIDGMPVVGIVGTRNCTPYGYMHAEKVGRELSRRGIAVATGLAKGIDTAAAIGALDGGSPVLGVIGCGIDRVYPAENKKLFERVEANGAIISEYPPGTPPLPAYFPQRNRIISGLSNGVAVIEAPQKSGALITADYAMEQGRDVFVLPGNVDSKACVGSNNLLRVGAIPFMTTEDILEEYGDFYPGIQKPIDNSVAVDYIDVDKLTAKLSDVEKMIVKAIFGDPMYIDEIIDNTGISAQTALASLTALELEGLAERNNIGKWEIVK